MSCEYQPSDLSCVLHPWQTPQYRWCTHWFPDKVSYPDWLETNIEYRLLDMRIWWHQTSFAVRDRTVGAMVWQTWHEPSVNLSRHYKTCSALFGELHRLGYRWHYCVNSLCLMVLHTRFLTFCSASTSTYTRNKVTINMVLTCIILYMWLFGIWYWCCKLYNQTCYTLLWAVNSKNMYRLM